MIPWQRAWELSLFALFLLAAAGWGHLALSGVVWAIGRARPAAGFAPTRGERAYLALTLGAGMLSWLTLLLGLAGLLYPAVAWALLGAGVVLLLMRGRRLLAPRPGASAANRVRRWPLTVPLLAVAVASVLFTFSGRVFVPPLEWDEIAYHLALPRLYVEARQIVYVPFIVHSNWPMNTQMLFTLGLLLDAEILAHLITWGMSLVTAGGLYLAGKRLSDRRVGVLAAVLFLTMPLVLRLSGTGLIDVSLAFYGAAALLAYVAYLEKRSLVWVGLAGVFAGLAAGSKLQGGAYPLLLGGLLLLGLRRGDRRRTILHLALFGLLALLLVGPWYARSTAFTGNPVWPFFYEVFGGRNWDALGDQYHTQSLLELWAADIPLSIGGFFRSLYYQVARPGALGYGGGLGRAQVVLAALGAVVATTRYRRTPRPVHHLLLFAGAYYLIWFLVLGHQARFLFPVFPALVLVAAYVVIVLWEAASRPWMRWGLAVLLLGALIAQSPWLHAEQRQLVAERWPVVSGRVSADAYLAEHLEVYPALQYANEHLPPDARVLLLPYENRAYYLERAYVWGNPISQRIIPFEQFDSPAALLGHLQAMGITHVLDNPGWMYTELQHWAHDRALMLALEEECGRLLAAWGEVRLYRLDACRSL